MNFSFSRPFAYRFSNFSWGRHFPRLETAHFRTFSTGCLSFKRYDTRLFPLLTTRKQVNTLLSPISRHPPPLPSQPAHCSFKKVPLPVLLDPPHLFCHRGRILIFSSLQDCTPFDSLLFCCPPLHQPSPPAPLAPFGKPPGPQGRRAHAGRMEGGWRVFSWRWQLMRRVDVDMLRSVGSEWESLVFAQCRS